MADVTLEALVPYVVLGLSVFCVAVGAGLLVMPWVWGWDIAEKLSISVLALMIVALSCATAFDVAHYLDWLT